MTKSKQPKEITTHKCPKCGGELVQKIGQWICPVCDSGENTQAELELTRRIKKVDTKIVSLNNDSSSIYKRDDEEPSI